MKKGIDYIGVGVGAAIFNSQGKIFLTLRGKKARNERGTWEIPGGSVEFGETFQIAVKREVREELGLDIHVHGILNFGDDIIPKEHQHWVFQTFICTIEKGIPKNLEPDKCKDLGWFTIREAEKLPLSMVTKRDMALLKTKYPKGIHGFGKKRGA
jgi:mutator protein MutT